MDWRDILAEFRAQETAVVTRVGDPEHAWQDFLDDLQALV